MAKSALTADYFYGQVMIPQIVDATVFRNVKTFIDLYEELFLELLLGKPLYDAYVAGMIPGPPDAKWTTLDGKLYFVKGTSKLSPAANYVYWYYMRSNATASTGSGEKVITGENSTNAGNTQKVKLQWNDMVRMNKAIISFIKANPADYPEYIEPVKDWTTEEAKQLYLDRMGILKTSIIFF